MLQWLSIMGEYMAFFDDKLLLHGPTAERIYQSIKDLPIIDYHCHLNEIEIASDKRFASLGELWLAGDHYKWRAMRLCGVPERLITGDASFHDKYLEYAAIMPKLVGNPLYYWTHMELSQIFGIHRPLNADTAEGIWDEANRKLKDLSVRSLLAQFRVQYIATTDDPFSPLTHHGEIGGIEVRPTFRPDACFARGVDFGTLEERLDYFVSKGCRIADHGFDDFADTTCLEWLMEACFRRGILLQLHFGTFRNVNSLAFESIGRDSGFDVFRDHISVDKLAALLDKMNVKLGGLPKMVVYPLNDAYLRPLAALSGAFPNVLVGAAWWFNDTVEGIRRQLETVSEYAVLGTNLGMLTDSRSFSSYVRFDFYRRILSSFLADKVDRGEYDLDAALSLAQDLAYRNVKGVLGL